MRSDRQPAIQSRPCSPPPADWGLYVHVPFCIRKCPYCDFYSTDDSTLQAPYLHALIKEMKIAAGTGRSFDTFYLGGGTPTVLGPDAIEEILQAAARFFDLASNAEVTLEANPGTVDAAHLRGYRKMGINRISIGIQSFDDEALAFLGRIHSAAGSHRILELARDAGFESLGLDLIYGLPGQSPAAWTKQLQTAVSYRPEHVSCYQLTVEPGTPLARRVETGHLALPGDEMVAELFGVTDRFLQSAGYDHYEISNFALRQGDELRCSPFNPRRSRHNQKYWSAAPYIGLGPSAHSFDQQRRWWNHRSLKAYLAAVDAGRPPVEDEERLTLRQAQMESVYLRLRTCEGLDGSAFRDRFGIDVLYSCKAFISDLLASGMARLQNERLALTPKGMLLHESICSRLIDGLSSS